MNYPIRNVHFWLASCHAAFPCKHPILKRIVPSLVLFVSLGSQLAARHSWERVEAHVSKMRRSDIRVSLELVRVDILLRVRVRADERKIVSLPFISCLSPWRRM